MEDELVLEGTVEDVIFHNDDNGYAVFDFKSDDGDEVIDVYKRQRYGRYD